jgi:hypothetical protein
MFIPPMFIPFMELSCAEARHNNTTTTTEQTTSESNPALATKTSRSREEELPGDTPDESMPTKKKERRGYQILRIETEGGPPEE